MEGNSAATDLQESGVRDLVTLDEALAEEELEGLRRGAAMLARIEISDAVGRILREDGRSLREIGAGTGLQAADLSRLARGKKGATVASLAQLALGLGRTLKISIE